MSAPIRFFLPGPTHVRPDVLQAATRPLVGHRSEAFKQLYAALTPRLQEVMQTRGDVLIATSSATLVMESAVVSTVSSAVLNLTCGAFSERWHSISRALGKQADAVSVPWGEAVDPDLVRRALRRKRYDAVTVAHNETSTGVINPLPEIARAVHEESDALLLIDTVSSLAGARVEPDMWGADVVLAGSQKALALPPGIAVFTFSDGAAKRAERVADRGFYTDLLRYRDKHRQGGTITTPAISLLYAMDRQLDVILEEGMEARWARHHRLQQVVEDWAHARGFRYASAAGARSPTVSCLKPPPGVAAPEIVAGLASSGLVVGSGYGAWKPTTFRIGHMGEVREDDLADLLKTIDGVTEDLRRSA